METRSGLLVFGPLHRGPQKRFACGGGHAGCWNDEAMRGVATVPALTTVRFEAHTPYAESEFQTRETAERAARGGGGVAEMMGRMWPWRWQTC